MKSFSVAIIGVNFDSEIMTIINIIMLSVVVAAAAVAVTVAADIAVTAAVVVAAAAVVVVMFNVNATLLTSIITTIVVAMTMIATGDLGCLESRPARSRARDGDDFLGKPALNAKGADSNLV